MGLIKSLMTATGSTLADEWIDYYYCDSLQDGVLLKKAQKQHSKNSSNTETSKAKPTPSSASRGDVIIPRSCVMENIGHPLR